MSRKLFGTDGIRCVAGQYPLDEAGALQIGKAVGIYFAQPGECILVGHDPRESSPQLASLVIAGLNAVGIDTVLLGVVPTPGLAYITNHTDARACVMITASHNPYTDNGIKVFTEAGGKLSDQAEAELNQLIEATILDRVKGRSSDDKTRIEQYEEFLVASVDGSRFEKLCIAVDTANGATCGIAANVFERLGAHVTPMNDTPSGQNINHECGATDTQALQKQVKKLSLDVGIAFDGDGDRVMMVDEKGRLLDGDYLLYILARTGHHPAVVATVMSNMGLDTAFKAHGIIMYRTAVGDRYVLEGLEQTGYTLGAEKSGHVILPQLTTTGDGMLAAVQVLKHVLESGKTLAQWRDELILLPQELVNIYLPPRHILDNPKVQTYIEEQIKQLDGSGRIIIRPSGTEPKLRVMVEAADAGIRAKAIADHLIRLFDAAGK